MLFLQESTKVESANLNSSVFSIKDESTINAFVPEIFILKCDQENGSAEISNQLSCLAFGLFLRLMFTTLMLLST